MNAPLCMIAAGGTGGHMFPAQSLAETLLEQGWRVTLSTDDRGARFTGGFPSEVTIQKVKSATPSRGGTAGKLLLPFRVGAGVIGAIGQMLRDKPEVIVGFGGYPTIPALGAGTILRIPRMIHEQNGVLGRVNELFARRVNAVACGTWPTKLPTGVLGHFVGNPVRQSVREVIGTSYEGPEAERLSVVIVGGSQGARILSDVVPAAMAALPAALRERLSLSHQARGEDEERVRAVYKDKGIQAEVAPFFQDVPERFAKAQLVISRSGASTVADIAAIGRPSILVPFAAAVRDEQTANARQLVEAEAAILIPEARFTPETLAQEVARILENPAAAALMAENALAVGRPNAAEHLAEMVTSLGGSSS